MEKSFAHVQHTKFITVQLEKVNLLVNTMNSKHLI